MNKKPTTNPYPGLRPFEFPENHLFFGREGQSEEVLRRLRESHFVAVVGTSGSGKSSLVRAGLLPLLYGGLMTEVGARWRVALFRPGDNPIHNLCTALVRPAQFTSSSSAKSSSADGEEENLKLAVTETVLRRSAVGLRDYAAGGEFAADENLLVVVDQFEELFRFKKENQTPAEKSAARQQAENEAAAFVKLLLEAARDKTSRVFVVITMRSDFLGDCAQFRDLPETINDGQYLIPRLTTEQLRKAIEAPAKVKGARIQPALAARLLNDIGDDQDQLPVLQHALMRTWDDWVRAGNREVEIGFDHYNATGGMATALSRHADEAFFELGDGGKDSEELSRKQKIAEKLFKCLTETDRENRETRRATALGKICQVADAGIEEVASVINVFRQPGRTFLMPPFAETLDENSLIDISHESLIRNWERLKKWVEEEAQAAQTYRRLAEDALLHKKGKMGFWSDPELKDAVEWKESFNPNATWAELYKEKGERIYRASFNETINYLEESKIDRNKKLAKEKRQRYFLAALAFLFFTTTIIAVLAAVAAFRSNERARLSEEKARLSEENARLIGTLQISNAELTKQKEELLQKNELIETQGSDLEEALAEQIETTKKIEVEKKRADEETAKANELKIIAEKNLAEAERQKEIASRERMLAEVLRKEAELGRAGAERLAAREGKSRLGQIYIETREYETALGVFTSLLADYSNDSDEEGSSKTTGIWWSHYNLGNINQKLGNLTQEQEYFTKAEREYKNALKFFAQSLNAPKNEAEKSDDLLSSSSRQIINDYGFHQMKAATIQKLAELYREKAKNATNNKVAANFNSLAKSTYFELLEVLNSEFQKQTLYTANVRKELADTFFDLNEYEQAEDYYLRALQFYLEKRNYVQIVATQKKRFDIFVREKSSDSRLIAEEILRIREDDLRLSPDDLYIAESYNDLAQTLPPDFLAKTQYNEIAELTKSLYFKMNYSKHLNGDEPDQIDKLAKIYFSLGKKERAEISYEVWAANLASFDDDPFNSDAIIYLLDTLINAARFYKNVTHNDGKAAEFYGTYISKAMEADGSDAGYPNVDDSQFEEAGLFFLKKGDYKQAEEAFKTILNVRDLRENLNGDKVLPLEAAETLSNLARTYEKQIASPGDEMFRKAEKRYKEAIDVITNGNEKDKLRDSLPYYLALVSLYLNQQRPDLAKPFEEKINETRRSLTKP